MNLESRCYKPKTREREVRRVCSVRKATDSVVLIILDPYMLVGIATIVVWFIYHFQGYIEEEGTTIFAESKVVERKAQAHFNPQVMGAVGVTFEKEHNTTHGICPTRSSHLLLGNDNAKQHQPFRRIWGGCEFYLLLSSYYTPKSTKHPC
jgi:hypothetical protein